MSIDTRSKIVAAVGVTAVVVAVFMIAAFFGYLYFVRDGGKTDGVSTAPTAPPTPRPKGQSSVAPADITKVEFSESVYSSNYRANAAGFLGNVNPQNNSYSVVTVSFASDGTATKVTAGERTVNGTKTSSGPTLDSASISPNDFTVLALALATNDFVNEEDSRSMTSLPIKKVLTVTYKSGVKVINTNNMDKDTPEIKAILAVFRALDLKMEWKRK